MSVNFNTSRSRFDEWKKFTGLYQRMGTVAVDADWNEEVQLRATDVRRRTADLADGSPDDGFRIVADFVIDPIVSIRGWAATGLPPGDDRRPVPELRLDRHDPESLPWVVRSRWHTALRRTLPAPIDLGAIAREGSTAFAASDLVFELRLERPAADEEVVDIAVLLGDADGDEAQVSAAAFGLAATGWCEIRVPVAQLTGIDLARVTTWGVAGLPPLARTWIGALRAVDPGLGTDAVIRGGDGTLPGAGRILVRGHRAFIARDLRYSAQPDFPEAEALADLPADGSSRHFFYLDVWEQTVTALDDPGLLEPALDGIDTTARLRTIAQVRVLPLVADAAAEVLPTPTGGGLLTTNIASGALPDRDPPEALDPCRDRCLFSENASTGEGYLGSDNLHVRIQVLRVGSSDVALWSRDNGATVMALTQAAAADATSVVVEPADAARLRAGDIIVVEDRSTRLRWDAPTPPVLRRLRGVQADTGTLELDEVGATLTTDPVPLPCGGPLGRTFSPAAGAAVRRWDGADLLITGMRYRLEDGITFAFAGSGWRSGDHWSFTARVHAPDGAAHGVVEQLSASAPHGPVHAYGALARATGAPRVLEDLRTRYLPLVQVRDRLQELGAKKYGPGVFVVVVGDGVRTFGDIDQALAEGLTGDEAIQAALDVLGDRGGSIFIRAGQYQLEHPVLVRGASSLRILGDGDATVLDVRGGGGAFYVDRCGQAGAVAIEEMTLLENPGDDIDIGDPGDDLDQPSVRIRSLFDRLLEKRFSATELPAERPLGLDDILVDGGVPDFMTSIGERIKTIGDGVGRVAGSVVATLIELRRLQRQNPGDELEDLPAAQPLLGALSALPHGVVTIADSQQVRVRGCRIQARRPGPTAVGVMITGTCRAIEVSGNRIEAGTGVAALPYSAYLASTFLVASPRAGLWLDGIGVIGNEIVATGAAATGVHLADGRLSGAAIDGNAITGFMVGILVADQAETDRDAATDRIVVRDNRVVGATAVGVQIDGDGVDVVGNEIRGAAGTGPFQAGVQLTGHSARIADCWIAIPSAPALAPVALLAGIVVGDGIDDGVTPARPVYDVELGGNRIEGSGADTAAIGIVVGGPQPIYGVRVRDNVLRDLGDAAIRTWSTSGPVGRLVIEGNRIERVALGAIDDQLDDPAILERLQPGIVAALPAGATRQPRQLLAALTASSQPAVRAALEAALRWVERLALRGAIVIAGVDGGSVRANTIAEVGTGDALPEGDVGRAEIRTAAIAVVGASNLLVADNQVEAVRAPYTDVQPSDGGPVADRPEMIDVLAALGFGSGTSRIDRSDVHLAVVDLRSRLLEYAGGAADLRGRIGRGLYGPLDTVIGELAELGGAAGELADNLSREAGALRSAQTYEQHTLTANRVRATLSQAASATAPDPVAQDTWDAAAQLDLASLAATEVMRDTATRLLQRSDSLTSGLADTFRDGLSFSLRRLIEAPAELQQQLAVAGVLGRIATLRDQQARKKDMPITADLVGPRRTIVATFADSAIRNLDALGGGTEGNADRIDELRQAKDALVDQLREVHGGLSADVAADFRDLDRTGGAVEPVILRLRGTLAKVSELAAGKFRDDQLTDEDTLRGEALARSANIDLYARSIDRQIGGLATESDESLEKSLRSFHGTIAQLGEITRDQPDLHVLAQQTAAAVATATADPTRRRAQLGTARSLLERLRGKLIEVLPPPRGPAPELAEPIERRLAGLGALALELQDAAAAVVGPALTAFGSHIDQVYGLTHADAGVRERAHQTIAEAATSLGDAPGPVRARAVHGLIGLADDAAGSAAAASADAARLAAAAALLRAAALAIDPADDAAARLTRVRAHLADRTTVVSASLVAQVQQSDLAAVVVILHDALARTARGSDAGSFDDRPAAVIVAPAPADGVFVAGGDRGTRIAGNQITEAVSGVIVLGAAGHLATEPAGDGVVLEVCDNRVTGCAVTGMNLRPDGASKVIVSDNLVFGCGGVAVDSSDPWGQAVMTISGSGDLVLRGNVFTDNGNTTLRAQLHELVVDWRGPAGIRGNTVRHVGGGAGGAGLLIITEQLATGLVQRLAQTPFLGVEPAPAPVRPGILTLRPDLILSMRELSPLSAVAREEDLLDLGGLRQRMASAPILQRMSTLPPTAQAQPVVAVELATRYLDRSRLFVQHPVIDFLKRPPIRLIPPLVRRGYDSIHVEGNDIDAAGPALLLLCEGGTLTATAIVGNELRTRGRAGAVYVRRTDSTVFTGNRCECLAIVTVVVIRVGKAPVTVSGNVLVGAEPVHQTLTPPPSRAPAGGVSLTIGLGSGALHVPVDARKLIGSLDRKKNLASDTFAELLADVSTAPPPPTPAPDGLAAPGAGAAEAVSHGGVLSPRIALRTRDALLRRGITLGSDLLGTAARTELAAAMPQGIDPAVAARTVYGRAPGQDLDAATALRKVVDTITLHEEDPTAAKVKIGAVLTAAAGDPKKALQLLDENVLGLGLARPTVKEAVANVSIAHEVLADILAADRVPELGAFAPVPRPAPPPNPSDHSLVVLGGTRVAAVGNATTSGVHVQDADTVVQLNP